MTSQTGIHTQEDGTIIVYLDKDWNVVNKEKAVRVKIIHPDGRVEFADRSQPSLTGA